jgi:hypothetical protein
MVGVERLEHQNNTIPHNSTKIGNNTNNANREVVAVTIKVGAMLGDDNVIPLVYFIWTPLSF